MRWGIPCAALVLCVLVSAQARAQVVPSSGGAPPPGYYGPEPEPAPTTEPVSGERLALEAVGGVLGFAVGVAPAIAYLAASGSCGDVCLEPAIAAGFGTATVLGTVPAGVTIAGYLMRGNGGYGWSLLGTAVGLVAGWAIAFVGAALDLDSGPRLAFTLTSTTLLSVTGGIVGYELSSD